MVSFLFQVKSMAGVVKFSGYHIFEKSAALAMFAQNDGLIVETVTDDLQ